MEDDFVQEAYVPEREQKPSSPRPSYQEASPKPMQKTMPKQPLIVERHTPHTASPSPSTPKKTAPTSAPTHSHTTQSKKPVVRPVIKTHTAISAKPLRHSKPVKQNKAKGSMILPYTVGLVVIIIGLIAGLYFAYTSEKTVAIVNGQEITTKDVELTRITLSSQYSSLLTEEQVLNQTILNAVLMQEAGRRGLVPGDAEVATFIQTALQLSGISEETFYADIKKKGINKDDVREIYKMQLSIRKLLQETNATTTVDDIALSNFYAANKESMGNATFAEAAPQIRAYLEQEQQLAAFEAYMRALAANSTITVLITPSDAVSRESPAEPYTSCATEQELPSQTILFVYNDDCDQCDTMNLKVANLLVEGHQFAWLSLDDAEAKEILRTCYSDVLKNAVPQFICAHTGKILVGEQPEQALRQFAQSCG